jgi:carboxypeptidase C (cathepsin A)
MYLEAPACVGFSRADKLLGCTHNDNSTAADNLAALQVFFTLFPEFSANPLWLNGESYAGL